jgi:tetratricopeptide (TPR) repeat protein
VPDDLENRIDTTPDPLEGGEPNQPLLMIPVEAADFTRRRRRNLAIGWSAALIVLATAGYLYKRSMDPVHAQESYDAGVRLMKITRYPQAILSFDRAIDLRSDFADAYLMRGRSFASDGHADKAIGDFTKVIELRPHDPQPWLDRARAYIDGKDYQSAIGDTAQALALDSNLADAHALSGTALRAMGNLDGALTDFSRAVTLAPVEANYFERGITYQMMGKHPQAIADFTQVISFAPDEAMAYFARAKSKRALGDEKGADEDHHTGRVIDSH